MGFLEMGGGRRSTRLCGGSLLGLLGGSLVDVDEVSRPYPLYVTVGHESLSNLHVHLFVTRTSTSIA